MFYLLWQWNDLLMILRNFIWLRAWPLPIWDFKPAWKQGLFTWNFVSAKFQNDSIFSWTFAGISFRVVFTWYFITWNEISFLSKWPIWNPYPHWVSNAHVHFPKIHRSVLRKITINLFYFWDVYDVNLWEKDFGRSTAYSCRTNVFI